MVKRAIFLLIFLSTFRAEGKEIKNELDLKKLLSLVEKENLRVKNYRNKLTPYNALILQGDSNPSPTIEMEFEDLSLNHQGFIQSIESKLIFSQEIKSESKKKREKEKLRTE